MNLLQVESFLRDRLIDDNKPRPILVEVHEELSRVKNSEEALCRDKAIVKLSMFV
jgi:hypothetical protein